MTRGQSAHDLIKEARLLGQSVDAVQISDNSSVRAHISSIAAAALLIKESIDPVLHLNCRHRNRIAVQSDLFGAQALGVSSVLLLRRGDPPSDNAQDTKQLSEASIIDLIQTAAAVRDVDVVASKIRPEGPELHVGTRATVFNPEKNWQQEKLLSKVDAGAQFIQLQPCMDAEVIKEYAARLVATKVTWRVQILAGVVVFSSAEAARQLKENRPNCIIPQAVIDRLERAAKPEQEGVNICAEVLAELEATAGIAGANVMTMGAAESIGAAIEKSGVRKT